MKVLLIDVDSKIPNLALMQISSYHKSKDHDVGFGIGDPDRVYISCVFRENRNLALGRATLYPDSEVYLGGSGINYNWLPLDMQKIKPDYDLYPSTYSMGFTTRGCFRRCGFCIVPEKEGIIQRWMHIKEFHYSAFNVVVLFDNNIFGDRKWFFENTDYLLNNNLSVDITQGMDVRLIDCEIAERLKELSWSANMYFAFDSMKDEKAVVRGIKILKDVGIDIRHNVQFLGTNAFVMPYNNIKTAWTKKITRWANRKWLFWSCDIDEYRG